MISMSLAESLQQKREDISSDEYLGQPGPANEQCVFTSNHNGDPPKLHVDRSSQESRRHEQKDTLHDEWAEGVRSRTLGGRHCAPDIPDQLDCDQIISEMSYLIYIFMHVQNPPRTNGIANQVRVSDICARWRNVVIPNRRAKMTAAAIDGSYA